MQPIGEKRRQIGKVILGYCLRNVDKINADSRRTIFCQSRT